jgi:PIN domain nuclease of toxin-antitoxin system
MNLLLDTHAFLWFIAADPRLSSQAQSFIQSPTNGWTSMVYSSSFFNKKSARHRLFTIRQMPTAAITAIDRA